MITLNARPVSAKPNTLLFWRNIKDVLSPRTSSSSLVITAVLMSERRVIGIIVEDVFKTVFYASSYGRHFDR